MLSRKSTILLTFICILPFLLNSCGTGADARKYPPDPKLRVQKNIEEGRGFRLSNAIGKTNGGNFEFASSNELWRASLDIIDFMSLSTVDYAGGLIITTSGFALLTGSFAKHKGMEKPKVQEDAFQRDGVSLTPLAIPMLAGPGSISFLIGLYEEYSTWNEKFIAVGAIFSVCLATLLVLRSSYYIVTMLGASGINAISRIIGFIVIAIGIEYISSSVINIFRAINQ